MGFLAFLIFFTARYLKFEAYSANDSVLENLFFYLVLFATIALFSFFVAKNNLTGRSSYKLLIFVVLLAIVPNSVISDKLLISNLFLLLAMRRVYSLRSKKRMKKKLFDAGFWIGMATIFYFPALLFFLWIPIALILFSIDDLKNWIVPLLGLLTLIVICMTLAVLASEPFESFLQIIEPLSLEYSNYNSIELIVGITIFISLGIWAATYYLLHIKEKSKGIKSSHYLVVYSAIMAFLLVIIAPNKNGSEFIFLVAPMAIIMTNFIEGISDKRFAEVYLWVLILTPLGILML